MTSFQFRFILLFILLLTPTAATGEWTALHEAAAYEGKAEVQRLLAHGADVLAKDKDGRYGIR